MMPSTVKDKPYEWLREACDAAIRGDVSKICACFGCDSASQNSSGLDDPLLCSPTRVHKLLELLFASSSTIGAQTIHPQHALRAILLIPPSYEAPWLAVCNVVEKSFHQKTGYLGNLLAHEDKALLSLVTEIQSFFHQTVAVWWELERRLTSGYTSQSNTATTTENLANTTPRQILLRLATIVMSPLRSPLDASEDFTRDNRRWILPLELLTTMVSLFRDLEEPSDQSLVSHILDVVFNDQLQPSCLLPWMTVVSDLRHNLRISDWSRLRDLICQSLTVQQPQSMSIDVSDLPGLTKAIVTLVSTNDNKESIDHEDVQTIWQQLILHLLSLASSNDATFSTVETVLQSSFATLQPPMLHNWLPRATNNNLGEEQPTTPDWIKVHLILLVSQASRQSGSQLISRLVAKALGVDGEGANDISKECWAKLVTLALPKAPSATTLTPKRRHRKQFNTKEMVQEVQRIFDGVSYNPEGRFVRQLPGEKEESIPSLTQAATLLRDSIFLGSVSSRAQRPSYHIFFAERAQWWVHAANNAVLQPCGIDHLESSVFDMLMAIIVTVVVYCEIPTSRSSVVRSVLKSISVDNSLATGETPKLLYCTIISIIVRSLTRNENAVSVAGLAALNPIADAFAQPISRSIFCPLAVALSPLPAARVSLLSFARKCLDAAPWACDHQLWWADGASSDRRDRIECGFHALCTLLGSLGDECGLEAWKMLSDFIVLRRPSLPCAARSMLYGCLVTFVALQRFNAAVCKHLLRACLVTLCTYCSDCDGHLEIIPERAFYSWVDSKAATKTRIVQKEDLASLLRLTCTLLRVTCQHDDRQTRAVERERGSLIKSILLLRNNDINHQFTVVSTLEENETITSISTMCLFHAMLRNIIKEDSDLAKDTVADEDQESISKQILKKLLEAERDELNSLGLDWSSDDQVPTWLGEVSLTGGMLPRVAADRSFVAPVQLAFCDLLLEIVLNPVWPFRDSSGTENRDGDELRHNVMASGFIVSRKLTRKKMIASLGESYSANAFDDGTFCAVARSCLRSSALFLKSAVSSEQSIDDIETAFDLALEVCETLQGIKLDSETVVESCRLDVQDLFRCVWELYCSVGTEDCSRRFIEYFEEFCAKQKGCLSTNSRLGFARIQTTDDVDHIMCNMRTSLVRTLVQCLSMLSMNQSRMPTVTPEIGSMPNDASGKPVPGIASLGADFLSSVLAMLCVDLRSGLDGMSGGVTNNSYMTYVAAIEGMACVIYDNVESIAEMGSSNPALAACRQGALLIEDILCSFPLRGAVLFKRSLRLALIQLPSLARFIGRAQAFGFTNSSLKASDELWTTFSFANSVFLQCMSVHARWAAEGMNTTTPWLEIAGPEHCSSLTVEEGDYCGEQGTLYPQNARSGDDIPAVIELRTDSRKATVLETKPKRAGGKIQLPVKECWSWASICALSAMEENWMESLKVLMKKNATDPSAGSRNNNWASYLTVRREELGSILQTMRLAFQQTKMGGESWVADATKSKKGGFQMLLAMLMPSSTKLRLCALLSQIAFVLRRSVKVLQKIIRGSLTTNGDGASMIDLGIVEALCCLSAWLCDKVDDSDFTNLAKQWYQAEKKLYEASQRLNALPDGEDPVLRRFPKLLCRVEELESATQTLHQMIGSLKDHASRENIRALDGLLKSSWEPSWDYDADDKDMTIRSLLGKKVKAFASKNSVEVDDVIETKEPASSRKKRRNETLRVHRRHVKRSRNGLVDKWLQLDQDIEDEGIDDDAYVELEDFLVDG